MKLRIADPVREALAANRAVVALESSVIAQGLPPPENREAAARCDAAVREAGAIPAAIALIRGEIRIGLSDEDVAILADPRSQASKITGRDLCVAVAHGDTGGTTVSATLEIAARAGIRVFATGGIGGAHRGRLGEWDVSADVVALSTFPVAVVASGAKSVLDLPKTLEVLETFGVPVVGVGTAEFPAFYAAGSGLGLEHRVDTPDEAAELLWTRIHELGQAGILFALPPPASSALDGGELDRFVGAALQEAKARKIVGKALTPFLLHELARRSGGRTVRANLELLEANARFAGALAASLARLGPPSGRQ